MNASSPRAVIFDWDNTLIDAWDCVVDAMNVMRSAFGQGPWTRDIVIGNSARSARHLFSDWYGEEYPKAEKLYFDHYRSAHLDHVKPLPGAEDMLFWLRERGVPLFVVSNKRGDLLREEAAYLGWAGLFGAVAGSLDAPRDKPAREPVDLVLGQAGLKADDPSVWFVGDTHGDIDCARNSGCTPVVVYNPEEAARMNVELSFADCRALLDYLKTRDFNRKVS